MHQFFSVCLNYLEQTAVAVSHSDGHICILLNIFIHIHIIYVQEIFQVLI